jgi:class 3 adenylate cyclase/tetratricopeptide (TPR) repeat protein
LEPGAPGRDALTSFREWLGQIGLAHCTQSLLENGIDFDVASELTESDLRSCGLNLGDSRRLLKALSRLDQRTSASSSDPAAVIGIPSKPTDAPLGERRQLTVMFCDLVGYTELTQRLDPEELDDLIRAYRKACTKVVAHYDGYVAQRLGDGLMVYFGSPNAHEDDAERCVRSALDIVQAVKSVAFAEPLAVRIGVATGPVVVGEASKDGNAEDGLAVGETPNLAARLQGLAGPDEVVIGPTTRRLVGNTFEVADLGVRALKGIVAPVRAWRVQAVLRTEGRFDAAHGDVTLTAFVGRDEEVAQLLRHWHRARSGEGQVVLLSGEPGIGKSRLTQVLRGSIKGEPHTALRYQCSPFRLNSPLYPIIEQSEFAAGFAREDAPEQKLDKLEAVLVGNQAQRAESAPLFAALLSLPTDRYPGLGLSPRRRKEKTFDALIGEVEALSRIQPVLIVFEDAHWIDPTSQELLDALVPRLHALPILLVLTFRPQYTPRWTEFANVATIGLTALPQHLGTELVGKVTQGKALPPEVLNQIVAHADGVPLFIEELTKSVLESQLLHEEDDQYTLLEPLPTVAIPTTLSASLMERLGRRGGVRELAQIGACIGREFSYELLAAISPHNGAEFEDELEQLTRTGLVLRRGTPPDAAYTFKHALVQDAAYDSLLKSKRQQVHAQIAWALEKDFRERVANEPEVLAHHHTQAGDLTAAIPLWRKAGESALARVALQEAVAYLEKGLAIVDRLEPSADHDSLELSLREPLHSARLQWHGWAAPDVTGNAAAILRLAKSQGRSQSLLIGLWGMWISTITQGRVAEAPAWAQRLLDEGDANRDIDLRILGHRASMSSHFFLGELRQADEQSDQVMALYDPSRALRWIDLVGNDVRTAVGVFSSQWLWMQGYPDRAAQVSDQKDADARRLGHPFDIGWALTWGSYAFDFRCEPERLLERISEAGRLGREQSIPILSKVTVPFGEGLAMLRMGQLSESISLLRQSIGAWNASGGHLNVPYLKGALAEALARQGDLDAGLRLIEECLEQIERPGWHERVWLPEVLRLKGWMLMRQGKLAEAEAQLRASIDWARRQEAKSWELRSSTTFAELLAARGTCDAAREVLAPIYGWFTEGLDTNDLKAARTMLESLR